MISNKKLYRGEKYKYIYITKAILYKNRSNPKRITAIIIVI